MLQELQSLSADELQRVLERCDEHTAKGLLTVIQDEIRDRCQQDGLYFLRFVRTRDEADSENAIKPFPVHLEYVQEIWRALDSHNKIIIAKSRQMMISWILCAYCCWWARFKGNQAVYWQARKDDDSNSMVALPGMTPGRMQFIEWNLPEFLRQTPRYSEGRIGYPNGSFVQALAGGADQIRGRVFSLLVEDEYAFQEEQTGVYTAVSPLIQKGAKAIFVSTPNGSGNQFARLYHGEFR